MMRSVMTVATEKSIGVAFSNPDVYFNYFTVAHTFINCYSYNRETMENFVKGLYGEIEFTKNTPFPLNRISGNN